MRIKYKMEKNYLPERIGEERIYLKKPTVELAQQMFDYVDEDRERLGRFLPWPPHIKQVADEIEFIEKSKNDWKDHKGAGFAIFRNEDNEYMGNIGAFNFDWSNESCEIGYWILGKFEGKRYMSDSVKALEKELFGVGFNRIVIMCESENQRSKNIPLKSGYSYEGKLREYHKVNNKYVSFEVYSKLKSEFKS